MRHRESHDADDLPPTPSIVILPPCFLCPQRCLTYRRSSMNIGCHSIAYCLGEGPWRQSAGFKLVISIFLSPFSYPTPIKHTSSKSWPSLLPPKSVQKQPIPLPSVSTLHPGLPSGPSINSSFLFLCHQQEARETI